MITLVDIKNAIFNKIEGTDPGKSLSVNTIGKGGADDSATIYGPSGFLSKPHDDIEGVVADTGEFNIVLGTYNYKLNITLDKGEAKIFSYDADGVVLASLKFDKTGKNVFNDGDRTAVAFDKLKEGFDTLVTDFNAHTHLYSPGPSPAAPTAAPAAASTAEVDDSEVEEVLFP